MTVRRLTKPSPRITVLLAEQLFVLDPATYRIDGYTDLALDTELRNLNALPATPYATTEQIWARAEALCREFAKGLSLKRAEQRLAGGPDGDSPGKGRILVSFEEQPEGWRSMGNGNRLRLELDMRSGKVVSFAVARGWQYGPGTVRVSSASAVATALGVAHGRGSLVGVQQYYATPNGEFGSQAGRTFAASRTCRLSYVVDFGELVVLVDCNTGDVLGGMVVAKEQPWSLPTTVPKPRKSAIPALAVRFLQLAGFPYETWTGWVNRLNRIDLFVNRTQGGSIGFTDGLVHHFFSLEPPSGKHLKPVANGEEACRRGKALVGSPSGYSFNATLQTWSRPFPGKDAQQLKGKKYYEVIGKKPNSKRTYEICLWADSGAAFLLEVLPVPPWSGVFYGAP